MIVALVAVSPDPEVPHVSLVALIAELKLSVSVKFPEVLGWNARFSVKTVDILRDDSLHDASPAHFYKRHVSLSWESLLNSHVEPVLSNWFVLQLSSLSCLGNVSHFLPAARSGLNDGVSTRSVVWNTCSSRETSTGEGVESLTLEDEVS